MVCCRGCRGDRRTANQVLDYLAKAAESFRCAWQPDHIRTIELLKTCTYLQLAMSALPENCSSQHAIKKTLFHVQQLRTAHAGLEVYHVRWAEQNRRESETQLRNGACYRGDCRPYPLAG